MGQKRARPQGESVSSDDYYEFLDDPTVIVTPVFLEQLPTSKTVGDTMSFGIHAFYGVDDEDEFDAPDDDE